MLKENVTKQILIFDALNSYHPNIKFTLEQSPNMFLDTQIIKKNNWIKKFLLKNLCIQFTGPR